MKTIRVPWIVCRADEVTAEHVPMEWRGEEFEILAYTEREAKEWWSALPESQRREHLHGDGGNAELGLF